MLEMKECKRDNLCVDCDDKNCLHAGQAIADCPKYHCDNPNGIQECEKCDFLKEFQDIMRNEGVKKIDDFVIVRSNEDLPKKTYEESRYIYLCVTESGRVQTCKFINNGIIWEKLNETNGRLWEKVVAYRRIRLPEEIVALCKNNAIEYLEGGG